jgi:predicted phosphodiesterase
VTAAIVSDLHLGAASGRDLLRRDDVRARLIAALADIDELVLLGDVVELREAPLAEVRAAAAPALRDIDRAMAGRTVTIVAGNHDHQVAAPLLEALRAEGHRLATESLGEPAAWIAGAFARSHVRLAYPGVWVRPDVYATHGHYLDVHNTVPTFERLAVGAVQRLTQRVPETAACPDDYEAALAPVYALAYALAQTPGGRALVRPDRSARTRGALMDGRPTLRSRALRSLALPAAVGALNAAGLGPLRPELSGRALRESALRGMREVLARLGVDAPHVVFGHTHRSGPHDGDSGWGGLVNTGSWIHEPEFLGDDPRRSPYRPGHVAIVPASGPLQLRNLLD